MKPIILTLTILALIVIHTNAQNFTKYFNRGVELYDSSKYYLAYKQFDASRKVAVVEKNTTNINLAQTWIDKAVAGIEAKMRASDSLAIVASEALAKAEDALSEVEQMLRTVEIAMFDKAVKARNKEWKGYENYPFVIDKDCTIYVTEILSKIDTLDFSFNYLKKIPKQIIECENLKSLNLLQNPYLDWKDSFEKLIKLDSLTDLKITTYNIDIIPDEFLKIVTGIELLEIDIFNLPDRLIEQKKLNFLKINSLKNSWNKDYYQFSFDIRIFNLTNLERLEITDVGLPYIPKEINNLINLKYLDLSGNELIKLPNQIGELKGLEYLNLSENSISFLPENFYKLRKLRTLNISYNEELSYISSKIINLENLEYLDIMGCDNLILPETISKIKTLKKIKCDYLANFQYESLQNLLKDAKYDISFIKNVNEITINSDYYPVIPEELKNIKHLHLRIRNFNQKIITLPENLYEFKNIDYLEFDDCNYLPKSIKDFIAKVNTDLSKEDLELLFNAETEKKQLTFYGLTDIPIEIYRTPNVTKIKITESYLETLPKELDTISSLENIVINECPIKYLPIELIDKIDSIYFEKININNSNLKNLPDDIFNNYVAEILLANGNNLTDISPKISTLKNLKFIALQYNNIKNIPVEISELTKLEYLLLSENDSLNFSNLFVVLQNVKNKIYITTDPYFLVYFDGLQVSLPFLNEIPEEFYQTINIQFANFENSNISNLSPSISSLVNLNELHLSHNKLSEIPKEIGELNNLKHLNLSFNQLTNLPSEIINCKNLNYLILTGNNFSNEKKSEIESWFQESNCIIYW